MLNENSFLGTFRGHNTRTIIAYPPLVKKGSHIESYVAYTCMLLEKIKNSITVNR